MVAGGKRERGACKRCLEDRMVRERAKGLWLMEAHPQYQTTEPPTLALVDLATKGEPMGFAAPGRVWGRSLG